MNQTKHTKAELGQTYVNGNKYLDLYSTLSRWVFGGAFRKASTTTTASTVTTLAPCQPEFRAAFSFQSLVV